MGWVQRSAINNLISSFRKSDIALYYFQWSNCDCRRNNWSYLQLCGGWIVSSFLLFNLCRAKYIFSSVGRMKILEQKLVVKKGMITDIVPVYDFHLTCVCLYVIRFSPAKSAQPYKLRMLFLDACGARVKMF